MAKRAKKPPKKREQPWMAAAREKLHAKAPRREDLAIQEAFAEIANHAVDDDPGAAPSLPGSVESSCTSGRFQAIRARSACTAGAAPGSSSTA